VFDKTFQVFCCAGGREQKRASAFSLCAGVGGGDDWSRGAYHQAAFCHPTPPLRITFYRHLWLSHHFQANGLDISDETITQLIPKFSISFYL
jgi:hypothetical protein